MNSLLCMRIVCWSLAFALLLLNVPLQPALGADEQVDEAQEIFFETQVRPLLMEQCSGCHGAAEQSGGLRVDRYDALRAGGEQGPALVPGDTAASLLMKAVQREGELAMPPDDPLNQQQVATLERWIADGAYWPNRDQPLRMIEASTAANHWAFQPVRESALPELAQSSDWIRTPVDAFVLQKLREHDLEPAKEADRRTLIRRVSFALTGLPPTADAVEQFVADDHPAAYEALVERLLSSPEYGQHWGRRWLDVARYADTKGYVYAREERFWVHAWTYRDWVINALNQDMPYDRFLLLQLAADQVAEKREDQAAMGFLTLGRRFLGVERDIIDDRIDVVSRGTMGLTVACARCHDHKYDPIPTEDYYSLYGVFASCMERLVPLQETWSDEPFASELMKRQQALEAKLVEARTEASARARQRVADYLFAQTELSKYPPAGFDQIFSSEDLLPTVVHRWEAYLRQAAKRNDRVFAAWNAYIDVWQSLADKHEFASQAGALTMQLQSEPQSHHPQVMALFSNPPGSMREVADRYGKLFADVERQLEQADESIDLAPLREVLYAPDSPCVVPVGPVASTEFYFDTATIDQLWKLQGEVDRWILQATPPAPHALTLVDAEVPHEPRVFLRGNPANQGENVPRRFLEALSPADHAAFQYGSGRLELAQQIIDPKNPLTARVIVNRIWASHFGKGLVETPSDFGLRAAPPSHPELLDWLAANLIRNGWSLKQLQRWIVLSSTFRQSSHPADSPCEQRGRQIDPSHRLLWSMSPRRLPFEEFRDALLAVGGDLDAACDGRPQDLFTPPYPSRRTVYGLVDRQFLPATLRVFDFANPDLHVASRSETTVPGQALFFLNHPWILQRAQKLAGEFSHITDPRERILYMLRRCYQRAPREGELQQALLFIASATPSNAPTIGNPTAEDWQYGYGRMDEQSRQIEDFQRLPHFTGEAWQGGEAYPDANLGWVQLTAEGGHPGNDLAHACVRRWTSPDRLTLDLRSQLTHQPQAGDGIRAFVVHSSRGILSTTSPHAEQASMDFDAIDFQPGEWLDFAVDIGEGLNSDQFLWHIELQSNTGRVWDSKLDFRRPQPQLSAWEQLAQVLLCSNEFLFID